MTTNRIQLEFIFEQLEPHLEKFIKRYPLFRDDLPFARACMRVQEASRIATRAERNGQRWLLVGTGEPNNPHKIIQLYKGYDWKPHKEGYHGKA